MKHETQKILQEFLRCPANRALVEEFYATNSEEIKLPIKGILPSIQNYVSSDKSSTFR
ncbi:hypothetical protein [Psychrobacillus sp.]|uniref:hypothetical protein n=1 Tax=Psychrobacillus sp. TaxID=1871623 RepID=UPI0028BEF8E8|nr:hypothetical protein [Psychrobacillus sp.]